MGVYCTVAEVRAEAEVPDAAPPSDATLEALITRAEERVDQILGAGWSIQTSGPSAGRKIVQADVLAWQWTKVKRATVRLAAMLYANPQLLTPATHGTVKGPEFEKSQPLAGNTVAARLGDVVALLNDSGLRTTGARARA